MSTYTKDLYTKQYSLRHNIVYWGKNQKYIFLAILNENEAKNKMKNIIKAFEYLKHCQAPLKIVFSIFHIILVEFLS